MTRWEINWIKTNDGSLLFDGEVEFPVQENTRVTSGLQIKNLIGEKTKAGLYIIAAGKPSESKDDWAPDTTQWFVVNDIGRLMNDTLSLNKLEKIIELEATLREEYQQKLDEKDASIAVLTQDKATLEKKVSELEQTVATQVKTITEVSAKSQDKQALEQRNRELHNRSDNMKEEVEIGRAHV